MRRSVVLKRVSLLLLTAAAAVFPLRTFAYPQAAHHKHDKHLQREEIMSLEEQWRKAQLGDDIPAMDKLLSDDYLGITANGEVLTKTQQLDRMKSRELAVTALDLSDIKIKLVNQVAIVTSLARVQGTSDGRPLDGSYRYTRVYQHLPSGVWKITNFEITHIRGSHNRDQAQQATAAAPTE